MRRPELQLLLRCLQQKLKKSEKAFLGTAPTALKAEALMLLAESCLFDDLCLKLSAQLQEELDLNSSPLYSLFLYLGALSSGSKREFNGSTLGVAVKRLLSAEYKVGGPYKELSGKVDFKSNLAVAYFFKRQGINSSQLNEYLLKNSRRQLGFSNYLSVYLSDDKKALREYLFPQKVADIGELAKSIVNGADSQEAAFAEQGEFTHALATARYIEALLKQKSPKHPSYQQMSDAAYKDVKKDLRSFKEPVKTLLYKVLQKVESTDTTYEIAGISGMFAECINVGSAESPLSIELYKANIYLWMSYTIYDDFLDNEGVPSLLPVANITMRKCITAYEKSFPLDKHKTVKKIVMEAFDCMDQANSWEVEHCRAMVEGSKLQLKELPVFKNLDLLAERAAGHIIGPLLLLESANLRGTQKRNIALGIHYYLIARQLNDDIHDWKQDLRNGQITATLTDLIKGAGVGAGTHDLNKVTEQLQNYFWESGFNRVTTQINEYCQASYRYFEAAQTVAPTSSFMRLLSLVEDSNVKSIKQYTQKKEFLKTFTA